MELRIPNLSLVVMMGCSGSGKSSFAATHFKKTEVISSDYCRGLVSDDENAQYATNDAFDLLHYIGSKRLRRGLLTVVDATNTQPDARKPLVALARAHDVLPVAIVLAMPDEICIARNLGRPDRNFGAHVIRNQQIQLRKSLRQLAREGFRTIHILRTPEEVAAVQIVREPLWNDRRHEHGPFDIIGDIHGCYDELVTLLAQMGYIVNAENFTAEPPSGRKAIFLGDLVDRGPKVPHVLRLVMNMVQAGHALCVPGNHDIKLLRHLTGRNVQLTHGLAASVEQMEKEPASFRETVALFIDRFVSHYVLDDGKLVVAHAGLKEEYQGRGSGRVREFTLYGETTGETDEFGLPVRHNWAAEYRGSATVVYGHTPTPEAAWLNNTVNIDTGCVFGGKLTALRYPAMELVSTNALHTYAEPARPLNPTSESPLSLQQSADEVPDINDVLGKRIINTRLIPNITLREENATAALEVMSCYAVNPRWLIYLPPTMSPTETSRLDPFLEHPAEAFNYFRRSGVEKIVCQEKHMGSRAIAVICRDEESATRRFGVVNEGAGIIYTRTGRRFFSDTAIEAQLLQQLRDACDTANLWEQLQSDWFCFDCELMPWSAKAQELLRNQYAAVGSAGRAGLADAVAALQQAAAVPTIAENIAPLLTRFQQRRDSIDRYITAYQQYCWDVNSVNDLRLAPFHLLASEGAVHADKNHLWHMDIAQQLAAASTGNVLMKTAHLQVDLNDPASCDAGINWWLEMTARGGEGMVVKPIDFIVRNERGLVQPAIKCRGPEYLRIIYGPEFDAPQHLQRLRSRGLSAKRSLAQREFSLGIEALERFVRREPLRRVHECTFAVLSLESEPVDPRL